MTTAISMLLARHGVRTPLERLGFQAAQEIMIGAGPRAAEVTTRIVARAGYLVCMEDLYGPHPELSADPEGNVRKHVERARAGLALLGFPNIIITHVGAGYSVGAADAERWVKHVIASAEHLA